MHITIFHEAICKLSEKAKHAHPTAFHHLLSSLAEQGRLLRLYSQNIDDLEIRLPYLATSIPLIPSDGQWPRTIQLHGSLGKMICRHCRAIFDFRPVFKGPTLPQCSACEEQIEAQRKAQRGLRMKVGKLRPKITLYQDVDRNLDEEAIAEVFQADLAAKPDALIVVGTSLSIPDLNRMVKDICRVVHSSPCGTAVWINSGEHSPRDIKFDITVRAPCDEVAYAMGIHQVGNLWVMQRQKLFSNITRD